MFDTSNLFLIIIMTCVTKDVDCPVKFYQINVSVFVSLSYYYEWFVKPQVCYTSCTYIYCYVFFCQIERKSSMDILEAWIVKSWMGVSLLDELDGWMRKCH